MTLDLLMPYTNSLNVRLKTRKYTSRKTHSGAYIMKRIKALELIAEDMKKDAKNFDGQPFNGRTVARYFGYHGAAIAALTNILKSIIEDNENIQKDMP